MRADAWLRYATERLTRAEIEDAAFDARCLLEDVGGIGRGGSMEQPLTDACKAALETALCEREQGRPLQYILGQWDFLSLTLSVGEGVLIPRPETELLCEHAAALLGDCASPQVADLCAGSGCVGLGLASLLPSVSVTAVELSDEALAYLRRNCAAYPQYAVSVVQGDVLAGPLSAARYDAILSNPPYIPTADLAALQREVQREPRMALDGTADGLAFYRAIATRWVPSLRDGGFVAVEVGYDQAEAVAALFRQVGLCDITVQKDYAAIPRIVSGKKSGKN